MQLKKYSRLEVFLFVGYFEAVLLTLIRQALANFLLPLIEWLKSIAKIPAPKSKIEKLDTI